MTELTSKELDELMYTVGEIARCVYPDTGEMPDNVTAIIVRRPLSAIGLMSNSGALRRANQEELAELMCKLPVEFPKKVPSSHDMFFWLGFYHYMNVKELSANLGKDDLIRAGQALYGDQWQTNLARDLGLSDARRIRAWLAGERKIPVGIWVDINNLLKQKQLTINEVMLSLK